MLLRLPASLLNALRHVPVFRTDPMTTRALGYAVRTTFASLLVLYIALALQLDEPHWAAMTVWIVGQPMRGMTLLKSYYRILGTLTGAIMAVVLTGLFAQQGTLFIVFFAGWIALCTFASTLMRNFRSYGAVLAGYTCGIIAFTAYGKPDEIFSVAVARVSCIFLGIMVEAAVSAIFVRSAPHNALRQQLRAIASDAAAVIAQTLADPKNLSEDKTQRVLRDIAAVDAAISYASAENADVRHRAGMLRRIVVAVMSAVSAAQALGRHFLHTGSVPPVLKEDLDRTAALLGQLSPERSARTGLAFERLRSEINDNAHHRLERDETLNAREFFVASRFSQMFGSLDAALHLTRDFFAGLSTGGKADLSVHRDYEAAIINAVRAFVALMLAWLFWYVTGWDHGPNFLRIIAVVCALFASRDNPVLGSRTFFNGALTAILFTGFCHIFILPGISGFELLMLLMAPCLIFVGYLMLQPKTAAIAAPFNFFFIALLGISNAGRYPFQNFLNDSIALLLGTLFSVTVFQVLLPVTAEGRRRRIQRAVLGDIGMLARPGNRISAERWCSRMADRIALLSTIRAPGRQPKLMERIIVAVEIGIQTINLRELARDRQLPAPCRDAIAAALAGLKRIPNLNLVPGLGTGFGLASWPDARGRDAAWLHDLLREQGALLDLYRQDNAATLSRDMRLSLLQAIAALDEIAEILATHYIGRTDAVAFAANGPETEAKGA